MVFPDRSGWRFCDGDMSFAQSGFGGFASDFHRLQVNEENVAFSTAGNDAQTAFNQLFRHGGSIDFHLFCVLFELRLQRFFKRYGFGSDNVHQRTALQAWEDGGIQRFFVGIVTAQNHTAARAAQGFVGGGGYEVAEWHRVRIFAAGNQTRIVRHVDKEVCADFIGDFAEFCQSICSA